MNLSDFRRMQGRVSRAQEAVAKADAAGFKHSVNSSAGDELFVIGVKSPEQLEDELLQLCVWIWSMKDYLKNLAAANGAKGQQIEDIVNSNDSLAIVADIANRDKHGKLTDSRTRHFAKLGNVAIQIKHTSLKSIAFGQSEITIDVAKPDETELSASIEFEKGNRPSIDAFKTIEDAIRAWETHAYPIAGA